MKCEKCGREMSIVLTEKGNYVTTTIWKCTNSRCGYAQRVVEDKKN